VYEIDTTGTSLSAAGTPLPDATAAGGIGASAQARSILEIPIATLQFAGRAIPWGGGGYFRLIPYALFAAGFRRGVEAATAPIFYLHPWEVDPGQPRVEGIRRSYRFRHYVNLDRAADRLRKLCGSVAFGRADEALGLR
jgi:hypothetical protein